MATIILYVFFTGCVYASWLFDSKDSVLIKTLSIIDGLCMGWLATPILIGRAIKQIYKD